MERIPHITHIRTRPRRPGDSEPNAVMAGRVGSEMVVVLPGSSQEPCSECGAACWIAKSSRRWIAKGKPVICCECAVPLLVKGEEHQRAAEEELLSDLGLDN